jgi:hypothetical protein
LWPCHLHFFKKYLKAKKKEELWKFKYFTMQKNIIFPKTKSSKRNQNPSRYHNSITNLNFQHKPNLYFIFQKSSYQNRPIIFYYYLVGAYKNPLSYYTLEWI